MILRLLVCFSLYATAATSLIVAWSRRWFGVEDR